VDSAASEARGVLLDAGCGQKPYSELFARRVEVHIGLELSPDSAYRGHQADIFGDVTALPIASGSIQTVLCTEVLEHLKSPRAALEEFFRVLQDGGLLILTAPFAFLLHDSQDYFRYSAQGLRAMLEASGFFVEAVRPITGTGQTLAMLVNKYLIDVGFMWTKWLYPIGLVARPALWALAALINLIGGLGDLILPSDKLAFGHLVLARKGSVRVTRHTA
jgi:SAM-dependent methyltransferase